MSFLSSRQRRLSFVSIALVLMGIAPAAGCQILAGLGGEQPLETGGTGGSTGGTTGGTGGSTGGTTTGGGGSGDCAPGDKQPCYSGPAGTEGVGACKPGERLCGQDGVFGACEGEALPTPEICGNATDEDCSGFDCGEFVWAKQLTNATFVTVAVDPKSGEVYAGGAFHDSMDVGGTTLTSAAAIDAFLIKYSPAGEVVWARSFGGANNQLFTALTVGLDGKVYAAIGNLGTIDLDAFTTMNVSSLARFDAQGTTEWLTETGGDLGFPIKAAYRKLVMGTDGSLFAGGSFRGSMLIDGMTYMSLGGSGDGVIVKIDTAAGQPQWVVTYGTDTYFESAGAIAPAPNGGVYLAGEVNGIFNFQGGQIVAGMDGDGFAARFDGSGTMLWGKAFGSMMDYEEATSVASDKDGNVMLGGFFNGSFSFGGGGPTLMSNGDFDLFAARLDQAGSHSWSARYGDVGPAGNSAPTAMGWGPDGGLVMIGDLSNGAMTFGSDVLAPDGGGDGFVAKVHGATGEAVWGRKIGGASYQSVEALAVGGDSRIVIGGQFEGAIVLGKDSFGSAAGTTDIFVAVMAP